MIINTPEMLRMSFNVTAYHYDFELEVSCFRFLGALNEYDGFLGSQDVR